MPLYELVTEDGKHRVTIQRPMSRAPRIGHPVRIDGKVFYRDLSGEAPIRRSSPGTWPMWSDACGVHPSQITEAVSEDRRRGVKADYCPKTGRIKFESPGHRKRWCEAHGFFDRNAGYSDPQRR